MENSNQNIVQQTILEVLQKMGFSAEVEIKEIAEGTIYAKGKETTGEDVGFIANILAQEDSSFLIGQQGTNLQALQHIIRMVLRNKTQDRINFILDINSYREERVEHIKKIAEEAARLAVEEKRAIIMKPMAAFERRIVHMILAENPKIVTESIGEGENRKVVVRGAEII
jgi:spoIIIJ-associated protein